jgi:dTDP-4-dehydrorhamnose 3,5-epimerase-like enzyme|tara:strand:+ start:452 stop:880 length:429 start_codon:yes stop_codon:yes gene_type:complete
MRIKQFKPTCNLNTVKDGRGAIFSFVPEQPVVEWTHQFIKSGKVRGNHCHPEFDEYILLVSGEGMEVEKDTETGEEEFHYMAKGECIFIPRDTYHVFLAITDCESVSFLTKRWNDCDNPIIHENLGLGEGDHGDPESSYHKE